MEIFIDCEWNDWKGELISMALVAENGKEFYQVLDCEFPTPWIRENVIPYLNKDDIPYSDFQKSLCKYLCQFDAIHIISDWPEDIAHFCNSLVMRGGERYDTPQLTMEVRRDIASTNSGTLHNALDDARAIRESYRNLNAK